MSNYHIILSCRFPAQKHQFKPYLISPAKRYISQTREKQALSSAVFSIILCETSENASHCTKRARVVFKYCHSLKNEI